MNRCALLGRYICKRLLVIIRIAPYVLQMSSPTLSWIVKMLKPYLMIY
jgi:hypothetical protein